jgi:hypothetical protein
MMMMLTTYRGIYLREHESSELGNVDRDSRPRLIPGGGSYTFIKLLQQNVSINVLAVDREAGISSA